MSFNEWYTLENRNYPDAGWLVGLFGAGKRPLLGHTMPSLDSFVSLCSCWKQRNVHRLKETLKGRFFSKMWEVCRMPSHPVSLGKWHEGLRAHQYLYRWFTPKRDRLNQRYVPQFSPLKSSETSHFAEHLVGSGVIALLSGCFSARVVSLPSGSGC